MRRWCPIWPSARMRGSGAGVVDDVAPVAQGVAPVRDSSLPSPDSAGRSPRQLKLSTYLPMSMAISTLARTAARGPNSAGTTPEGPGRQATSARSFFTAASTTSRVSARLTHPLAGRWRRRRSRAGNRPSRWAAGRRSGPLGNWRAKRSSITWRASRPRAGSPKSRSTPVADGHPRSHAVSVTKSPRRPTRPGQDKETENAPSGAAKRGRPSTGTEFGGRPQSGGQA